MTSFNYVAPVFVDEIKVPLYWDEDDPVPRSCHKEPNGKQKKDYPVPGTVKQVTLFSRVFIIRREVGESCLRRKSATSRFY
jgi:hypothetical protein